MRNLTDSFIVSRGAFLGRSDRLEAVFVDLADQVAMPRQPDAQPLSVSGVLPHRAFGACHYDTYDNLAAVAAGRRHFTLSIHPTP